MRQPEAQIGLVGAVAVHRLPPGEAEEGGGELNPHRLPEEVPEHSLEVPQDILLVDEGELHIHLRELGLAVGAQVLVAEAPRDLIVSVDAGDHQELLKDLRRLGQRVEFPLVHPAGHEVVARALGGGLDEGGRLDLEEAVSVVVVVRRLDDLMAHQNGVLHLAAAQVEVAVFEPQLLLDVGLVGDLKGRGLRLREDAQVADIELDLAGGQVGVDRLAAADLALRHQHEFRPHRLRPGAQLGVGPVVEGELHDSRAVPQVDEDEHPLVARALHPAAGDRFLPDVLRGKFSAVFGAFQSLHGIHH